jgi:O-antigen ligase
MTRFTALSQGVIFSLIVGVPLLRLAWDQWAQTLVAMGWSFITVLGAVLILLGRTFDWGQVPFPFRSGTILWGVVLASSLISTLTSSFPHSAIPGLLNDFPAVAFWCVAALSQVKRRDLYRRAFALAGVVAVVAALIWSGDPRGPWTGPLVNPNVFAALVILTFPHVFSSAVDQTSRRSLRAVWGGALVLMVLGLFLSRSLMGVVVFGVQGIVLVWRTGVGRRWVLFIAGLILLFSGGLYLARSDWWKIFQGDPDRWTWMATALKTFSAHPLFGVGPGAFGEAYPLFRVDPWGLNSLYAHNFILEIVAERGIIGGGALLGLIGLGLWRVWRNPHTIGLAVGLAGFCLFNLFHIGFSFPGLFWLFVFGLGLAGSEISDHSAQVPNKKRIALVGVLGLAVGVASFAVFRANQLAEKARVAVQQGQSTLALDWAETGLRWNPWYPPLYQVRAALRLHRQDWDGASDDLRRTVSLAPSRAGYRMERAELAWERGERDLALAEYERATELLPLKAAAWERRGDLLMMAGRRDEAARAYEGGLRALADPRVLGGDAARRAESSQRIEEKRKRVTDGR